MAASFCRQCGSPLAPGDRFCRTCGTLVPASEPTASMHAEPFSIGGVLSFAWRAIWDNVALLVVLALATALVDGVVSIILGDILRTQVLERLASYAVGAVIGIGWVTILLEIADGKKPVFNDFFNRLDMFLPYLIVSVLLSLMVGIGFIFFIVPGVYLALRFGFASWSVVDRSANVGDAFGISSRITQGVKWQLFGLALASLGIIIIGAIALVVGLLVAGPMVGIAWARTYRLLMTRAGLMPGRM